MMPNSWRSDTSKPLAREMRRSLTTQGRSCVKEKITAPRVASCRSDLRLHARNDLSRNTACRLQPDKRLVDITKALKGAKSLTGLPSLCNETVDPSHHALRRQSLSDSLENAEDLWEQSDFRAIERAVHKRVMIGMVLTTRCCHEIEHISQQHLKKRINRFLMCPLPSCVVSAQPDRGQPRTVTPLPVMVREEQECVLGFKNEKVAKIYGETLKCCYPKDEKSRYIRGPLTPLPSVDWVFES